jgi:hypothetical protein
MGSLASTWLPSSWLLLGTIVASCAGSCEAPAVAIGSMPSCDAAHRDKAYIQPAIKMDAAYSGCSYVWLISEHPCTDLHAERPAWLENTHHIHESKKAREVPLMCMPCKTAMIFKPQVSPMPSCCLLAASSASSCLRSAASFSASSSLFRLLAFERWLHSS